MSAGITKEQSRIIKGVAILLMVYHHLFLLTGTAPNEALHFFIPEFTTKLAYFGKICVGLFAFITGYSLYKSYDRINSAATGTRSFTLKAYTYAVKHILSLYGLYILSFIIIAPIEYLTGVNPHSISSISAIIHNILAINHMIPGSWNALSTYDGTVWYLPFYASMLLFFPIIHMFFELLFGEKNRKKMDILVSILISGITTMLALSLFVILILLPSPSLSSFVYAIKQLLMPSFAACMFIGYLFSRFRIYERIWDKLHNKHVLLHLISSILSLIIIFVVRSLLAGDNPVYASLDFIMVPILVMSLLTIIGYIKPVGLALGFLGKLSTFIWFTHLHFVALLGPKLLSFIHIPVVYYVVIVFLSLLTSIVLTFIVKKVTALLSKPANNK